MSYKLMVTILAALLHAMLTEHRLSAQIAFEDIIDEIGDSIAENAKDIGGDISDAWKDTDVGKALIDIQKQTIEPEKAQFRRSKLEERLLPPTIEWSNPEDDPEGVFPVYFVNGILNTSFDARESNKLLSRWLRQPTGLIYNISNTKDYHVIDGTSEVIRDRLNIPDITDPDATISGVTRQVAHVLYFSETPLTIVAHSHGALITRNALHIVHQLGRGPWLEQNVRLVFCGAPVSTESVPKVNKLEFITNEGDIVAQWIGLRGGPGAVVAPLATLGGAHSFSSYVDKVRTEMTWPRGGRVTERQDTSIDRITEHQDSDPGPGRTSQSVPEPNAPPAVRGFQIVNNWIRNINLEYRVNNTDWVQSTIARGASVPCTGTVIIRFQSARGTWRTITCSGDGRVYEFRGDEQSVDLFH